MNQEQEQPSSGKRQHRQVSFSGDQEISNESAMPNERESDENNSAGSFVGSDATEGGLERRRFRVERATVIVAVAALLASIVTGSYQAVLTWRQANIGERQAEISAEQVKLSDRQNSLSSESIQSARFQSIYERMLDVGRMLADKPTVAQVVYQVDADTAAEIYVLDFDLYAWDNVRYLIKPDAALYPSRFSLRNPLPGSGPVEKVEG